MQNAMTTAPQRTSGEGKKFGVQSRRSATLFGFVAWWATQQH